jgi:hypothetical protein
VPTRRDRLPHHAQRPMPPERPQARHHSQRDVLRKPPREPLAPHVPHALAPAGPPRPRPPPTAPGRLASPIQGELHVSLSRPSTPHRFWALFLALGSVKVRHRRRRRAGQCMYIAETSQVGEVAFRCMGRGGADSGPRVSIQRLGVAAPRSSAGPPDDVYAPRRTVARGPSGPHPMVPGVLAQAGRPNAASLRADDGCAAARGHLSDQWGV